MTDPNYTALAVVLDRSGSMSAIKSDAEGGLKQFIADQKGQPGKITLTLARFDTEYELVYVNRDLYEIDGIKLQPRGGTALLDAIGRTITKVGEDLESMTENDRPGKVLFVIITDGMENSSVEWTREKVFEAITRQRDTYGWEFIFLAANQDAVQTGREMGIADRNSMTFAATGEGARGMAHAVSSYVTDYRQTGKATLER
jgi:Mg-chelatase subunit ChlD